MNQRLEKAKERKSQIHVLKDRTRAFFDNLKFLNWQDLNVKKKQNGNSWDFTVTLSDALSNEFNKIIESVDIQSEYGEIFHYIIYGHPEDSFDKAEWHIQIRPIENNRIHINANGLPWSFREKGLGSKIYKKIINEVGYISTNEYKSYKLSHLLWESLVRDKELYCFISSDEIIAILKDNIPTNILGILEQSFGNKEPGTCIFDPEFCSKYIKELKSLEIQKHCT